MTLTYADDGRGSPSLTLNDSSWREDFGYLPTGEDLKAFHGSTAERIGLSWATIAPAEGDVTHSRYHLICDLPSCNYRHELRDERLDKLHKYTVERHRRNIGDPPPLCLDRRSNRS